ncbi:hypothetical protein HDV01_003145 [Terramyces sp. JEL0728]|nr:hypothetical protein HDV01_003145 [Terramyces sp. JEL0728]
MDTDINRWRNIGATKIYSHPAQKVVFAEKIKDKHPPVSSLKYTKEKKELKQKKEGLGSLMDRYVLQQRKEVLDLASGYLSANKSNKILEDKAKEQKQPGLFGVYTPKNILDEENGIGIGAMHDILGEFDSVKKKTDMVAQPENPKVERQIPPLKKVSRKFIEPFQLHLTKIDQYKVVSQIKSNLISDGVRIKYCDTAKQDKLKKFKGFIQKELSASECPEKGPDVGRLSVYSTCFEQIIQEFTTFGPLLAEIKAEYDKILNNYQEKEDEFTFLRTKVQKLISQNENRFLLRFEKQKCTELEQKIETLETENDKLKKDMIYKLTVYASYLPESILAQHRKDDLMLQDVGEILPFELGKDPLSLKDQAISERDKLIREKMLEIQELRQTQEAEFVPRVTKEKIEENLRILEQKYKTYSEQNAQYEIELAEKKERVRTLENQLREKEQQYQFLMDQDLIWKAKLDAIKQQAIASIGSDRLGGRNNDTSNYDQTNFHYMPYQQIHYGFPVPCYSQQIPHAPAYSQSPSLDVGNLIQTIALQTLQIQQKVLADALPKPHPVLTDAQLRRERYRNFVIPKAEHKKPSRVGSFGQGLQTKYRISFAKLAKSRQKTEFDFAIEELAEMIMSAKEYKALISDVKEISQDTDFLIKEGGLGGLFAKKPSKSKVQVFGFYLESLCRIVTLIKYENYPQVLKDVLSNIVKDEKIPLGYYWENEQILQALKNEEAWSVAILYLFFVKTLIFKCILTGFKDKSAIEEHNLRALSYLIYRCIRNAPSNTEEVLEFEPQFKRGIQFWMGSSETANQWDDAACKLLYKTFDVNIDALTGELVNWTVKIIEKAALKDANVDSTSDSEPKKEPASENDSSTDQPAKPRD